MSNTHHDAVTAASLMRAQAGVPARPLLALVECGGLLLLAIALIWPVRLWLIQLAGRLLDRLDADPHFRRQGRASATIVLTCILVAVAAYLTHVAFQTGFVLLKGTDLLIRTAIAGLIVVGLGLGIGRALRSPDNPSARPIHVPDAMDRQIGFYPLAGGIMLAFTAVVDRSANLLHVSPESWAAMHGFVIVVEAILFVGFLVAIGRSRSGADEQPKRASIVFTSIGWIGLVVGFVAFLLGDSRFAVLLFQELIWAAMLIITAVLLNGLIEATAGWIFGSGHITGRFAMNVMGISRERLTQFGIVVAGLASFAVWLMVVGLVMMPFGGAGASLVDQLQPSLLVTEMNRLHLSFSAILTGLVVIAVGVVLTRLVRRWLERQLLPATTLDVGVRTSILTGLSYAGIVVALLAGANASGIALDKITLVASALSVGIGFGLQSIIQNFVSGVILLLERPIKVGDWVGVSGAEGSVRRIKVRATELAMPDGSITIVPNSSFISSTVQNSSGAGIAGRIELTLKIAGEGAIDDTRRRISSMVEALPFVRRSPSPKLLLTEAADDSLAFTLQVYGDPELPIADVHSDLIGSLATRMKSEGWKASVS